jgi:hypothetical protein
MNVLKQFLTFVLIILRAFLYGWFLALAALIGIIWQRLEDYLARLRLPGRLSKSTTSRCVKISDPAFKRPDPMIYDQYYLMSQGISVTWDNPDIHIEKGGVPVPPHQLKPDTVYDIVARIWNNSTEAPVVDLPVEFSYLSFGIGTHFHSIPGPVKVPYLDVKGGPGQPAFATKPWKTPPTPGHYCIQVFLNWIDDANPNNNLGQTNTNVVAASSPALFSFQLRNSSQRREQFRFELDAYTIPPPVPCDQKSPQPAPPRGSRLVPGTVLMIPPQHDRRNAPQMAGWAIELNPLNPVLAPGDEITVQAVATPPVTFHGRQSVNVHAFDSNGIVGGVTVYLDVP